MTGKLSAEALMDIEDYARAAQTGGTLDRKSEQIGRLACHNAKLLGHIDALQAENEQLRDRVTELDAAITAYMLGHIGGGEVSRVQHRQWFPLGGDS